jgi:hypothetical protein
MAHSLVLIQLIADLTTLAASATGLAGTVLSYCDRRADRHSIRHARDGDKNSAGLSAPPDKSRQY